MPLKDFNETFADELRNPEFAALYLQYALEDGGMETFLVALRNVPKARSGMTQFAQGAKASTRPFRSRAPRNSRHCGRYSAHWGCDFR